MYYNNPENRKNFFSKLRSKIMLLFSLIRNWGHVKLTVMFVPHSEKKIFNFQISNFTIIFSALLLAGLIATSIFAIKSQGRTTEKKEILHSENISISKQLNLFMKLTRNVYKSENALKTKLIGLINNSGSAQEKLKNIAFPAIHNSNARILFKKQKQEITPVKELVTLKKSIKKTYLINHRLNQIKRQIHGFRKIMKRIPSIWPIFGGVGRFASGFGIRRDPFTGAPAFHTGVDIVTMPGHPVRATADGKVVAAKYNSTNGIYVDIQHDFGYMTNYSHLLRFNVKKGDYVKKNQIIGYVGTTGRSTGYHLHYEVRRGYNPINPAQFLYLDKFQR